MAPTASSAAAISFTCKWMTYARGGRVRDRGTVIQKKTGLSPAALRALSPHIEKIRDEMSDSRARKIHRPTAIYGEDETDER